MCVIKALTSSNPSDCPLTAHVLRRNRTLRRIFASTAVSLFGTEVTLLALPLMAITTLKATPLEVAMLGVLEYLPFLAIGLFAGAVMDRRRRRPVMLITDIGRAIALASIPISWAFDLLSLAQIYVVVVIVGCFTVFFDVSAGSFLPDVVDESDLVAANSAFSIAETLAITGGPGFTGILLQVVSAPIALVVDVGSYVLSALFIGRVSSDAEWPAPKIAEDASLLGEIRVGLTFVWNHPTLAPILRLLALFNLFWFAAFSILSIHLIRDLGFGTARVGVVYGLGAAGSIVGVALAERISSILGIGRTVSACCFVATIGVAVMWTAPLWSPTIAMIVGMSLSSGSIAVTNVLQVSYRSAVTPPDLRGRMNASFRMALYGIIPIGFLAGGLLSRFVALRSVILVGAIGTLVSLPFFLRSPAYRIGAMPSGDDRLSVGVGEAEIDERAPEIGTPALEVVTGDGRSRGRKRQLPHVYRWNDMKMHMWDLVPSDYEPYTFASEDPLLREADALARHYEMLGQDLGQVDPFVDFDARDDEHMAGSHRVNGEKPDAVFVAPDERTRYVAVDDARKDGSHGQ
jgi:MFS family permease